MQDTIIKGTGNSRTLASVPNFLTLYPTYEAFAQALLEGTLPIDIGPLNPAGVEQYGTDLTKANLLADSTATGMSLNTAATPNDAFAKLMSLVSTAQSTADQVTSRAKFQYGNQYPTSSSTTISVSFTPRVLIMCGRNTYNNGAEAVAFGFSVYSCQFTVHSGSQQRSISWGSSSVTIGGLSNYSNTQLFYAVFG